jgi:hypothetical protein
MGPGFSPGISPGIATVVHILEISLSNVSVLKRGGFRRAGTSLLGFSFCGTAGPGKVPEQPPQQNETEDDEYEANDKHLGTPGGIRTPDFLLRRQALYPAELRAQTDRI